MNNFKKFFAGLALAAGIAFAPVTAFAAETENDEIVFETAEVETAQDVVFSIPTTTVEVVEETVEATAETTEETVEVATTETVEEVVEVTSVEETEEVVEDAASTDDTEEVVEETAPVEIVAGDVVEATAETTEETVEETVEEVVPVEETVEIIEEVVEEATPAVGETAATEEVAEEVAVEATQEATEEVVNGEQVGEANRGYAHMSDGSDAFCVEVEKDHIEEDVDYVREDDVDGSQFNNIFVARQNAMEEASLSEQDINSITQLAIWAVLSGESYLDLVDFYYHEAGIELYNKMFEAYEGEYNFNYWSYVPNKDVYQKLISGTASKVTTPVEPEQPEEPETPDVPEEPETPDEPVIPDEPEVPVTPDEPVVPEQPEVPVTPDVPTTPDVPEVPTTPEQPVQPEQPAVPETPVEEAVVTVEPVVLSETFEAPVEETLVPVLSARMAQTGDDFNIAANIIIILAALMVIGLLVKKENN